MNVRMALERAQAEERRLAQARRKAWDTDPGNHHMAHVFLNAHGYHTAWHEWNRARERVAELERELAMVLVANDTTREAV